VKSVLILFICSFIYFTGKAQTGQQKAQQIVTLKLVPVSVLPFPNPPAIKEKAPGSPTPSRQWHIEKQVTNLLVTQNIKANTITELRYPEKASKQYTTGNEPPISVITYTITVL